MNKLEKLHYAKLSISALYIIIACVCAFYAWNEKIYRDFDELPNLLLAFGALIAFLFPSEMSEFDSHQGWNSRQWRHTPSWSIQFLGFLGFPYFAYQILAA